MHTQVLHDTLAELGLFATPKELKGADNEDEAKARNRKVRNQSRRERFVCTYCKYLKDKDEVKARNRKVRRNGYT